MPSIWVPETIIGSVFEESLPTELNSIQQSWSGRVYRKNKETG